MSRRRTNGVAAATALALATLAGCTGGSPSVPAATGSPTPGPSVPTTTSAATGGTPSASPSASPSITEPTTTNTLPPPPEPSKPAASTAGTLTGASLPVPAGWHRVAKKGGDEEGFKGNGTWVHARDPRYAATDTITIGCAEVTRDDFTDPVHALEGDYTDSAGRPGVGLVLQFRTVADAAGYLALYRKQVAACTDPDGPVVARTFGSLTSADALVDQRSYPGDDRWTEIVERNGVRLTLIILSDPKRRIDATRAAAILHQITG